MDFSLKFKKLKYSLKIIYLKNDYLRRKKFKN